MHPCRFWLALWAVALVLASCGPNAPRPLVVYAATSTRDAMAQIQSGFEAQHGCKVIVNFGGSGDLARQIVAAGQADVFLSADDHEMNALEVQGLLFDATRQTLLSNQLVVVEPNDCPSLFAAPFQTEQLAQARVARIAMGAPDIVPAGRYAREWLLREGVWEQLDTRVLPTMDVRAALAAVESGVVPVGIVYLTDAKHSKKVRVAHLVTGTHAPEIQYPVAVLQDCRDVNLARAFVQYLKSESSTRAFEELGFLVQSKAQD
jgi:molybdate transport system substrate-binding protein